MNRGAASSYGGGVYATPRTNPTRVTPGGARRIESATSRTDYSSELRQKSQRNSYFIIALLSVALVVGLVLKFGPSSGHGQESASQESASAANAEAGQTRGPR